MEIEKLEFDEDLKTKTKKNPTPNHNHLNSTDFSHYFTQNTQ